MGMWPTSSFTANATIAHMTARFRETSVEHRLLARASHESRDSYYFALVANVT